MTDPHADIPPIPFAQSSLDVDSNVPRIIPVQMHSYAITAPNSKKPIIGSGNFLNCIGLVGVSDTVSIVAHFSCFTDVPASMQMMHADINRNGTPSLLKFYIVGGTNTLAPLPFAATSQELYEQLVIQIKQWPNATLAGQSILGEGIRNIAVDARNQVLYTGAGVKNLIIQAEDGLDERMNHVFREDIPLSLSQALDKEKLIPLIKLPWDGRDMLSDRIRKPPIGSNDEIAR